MRSPEFYLNAIKTDLLRVVQSATGRTPSSENVRIFLQHCFGIVDQAELNESGKKLIRELKALADDYDQVEDDIHKRQRWAEKVLTISYRL